MIFLLNIFTFGFECILTGNGLELTIRGVGVVDQEISRSKGSYNLIQKVKIEGANGLAGYTFSQFSQMTEIVLPSTLDSIGKYCFKECSSLQNFIIPEGVTSLQEGTFFNCITLQSIQIPKSLQVISTEKTFTGNKKITEFHINEFNEYFSSDITNSFLMNKNCTVLYKGPATDQIIPSSVKIIEQYYSYYCDLKSISFENSTVEIIKSSAFVQENIEEIVFPNTLLRVENDFFSGTLKKLTLPDSLEYFDDKALNQASGLIELNIGSHSKVLKDVNGVIFNINESVVHFVSPKSSEISLSPSIDYISQAQVGNHNILSVSVSGWSDKYQSYENILYTNNYSVCYACPGGLKDARIINNCTIIDSGSFSNNLIERVILPDGIEAIRTSFSFCPYLQSINIPQKLKSVGSYSFADCFALKIENATFPKVFQSFSSRSFRGVKFGTLDMQYCENLTTIPDFCFQNCRIEFLNLPPNLEYIGESSFGSAVLESVSIPPSTKAILKQAFSSSSLKRIEFEEESLLESIGISAFEGSSIEEFKVPKSLQGLPEAAFRNCKALKDITFESKSEAMLSSIGFEFICGCDNLTSFEIPPGVSEIVDGAFSGSLGLISLTTESTKFKAIENVLFADDGSTLIGYPGGLESGLVKRNVKRIAAMAFRKCSNLITLKFEEGLEEIGSFTFYLCTKLSHLSIPNSILCIEKNAFNECESLITIEIGRAPNQRSKSLSKLNESLFEGCAMLEELILSLEISEIGNRCLFGCSSLKSFVFPYSVRSIGASAFEGCVSLRSIKLNFAKALGPRSFAKCSGLEALLLGKDMESVGAQSFDDCASLSRIIYCGKNESAFDGFSFRNVGAKIMYVPLDFAIDSIAGLKAFCVVDKDCEIPSDNFTADVDKMNNSLAYLALIADLSESKH